MWVLSMCLALKSGRKLIMFVNFLEISNDVTNIYEPSRGIHIITITICKKLEIQNRFALIWQMKDVRGHKSHF